MGEKNIPADLPIVICDEVDEVTQVRKSPVGRQTRQNTRIQEKDLLCTVCWRPISSDISTVIIFQCCNCFIDFNGLSYGG